MVKGTSPPTSIESLKLRSESGLDKAQAQDYSLRSWLNTAHDAFEKAITRWQSGRQPDGDPVDVEEAFVSFRRGARLLALARKHPGFQTISGQEKATYARVVPLMQEATTSQTQIRDFLEERERSWIARYGSLDQPTSASTSAPRQNGSSSSQAANSTGSNGGSASHSAPSPPATSSQPASSPPLVSLSDRMAALKAHGMAGTKPAPRNSAPRPVNAPPVSYVPPPTTLPSSSSTLQSVPTDRSPESSSRHAFSSFAAPSPPPSPRTRTKGDFAEDSAVQRTGSAPPSIPVIDTGDLGGLGDMKSPLGNALPREDGSARQGSSRAGGSPTSRYGELSSLPSPTDFSANFPSIDDFENSAPGGSSPSNGDYAFPSVPSSLPSVSPGQNRISLPPPPRAFEMDARALDEERRLQQAASASFGGVGMQRATSGDRKGFAGSSTAQLPASLIPGGGRSSTQRQTSPAASTSSRPPLPPPTASSSQNFNIPFTAEVSPTALFRYLETAQAERGKGPRVLLLDVRSREEYERGRVMGETVCLEPVVLRPGITSTALESALSLSPQHEQDLFAARNCYDMIVIYDRSSLSTPNLEPHSTSSEAQRVLWTLNNAIYEREFYKHLKRQPVLLKGGWEAWEKYVGAKGIVRDGVAPSARIEGQSRTIPDDLGQMDIKQAHRKASVVPETRPDRKVAGAVPLDPPRHSAQSSQDPSSGYFSTPASYPASYQANGTSLANSGLISPRLAMPPTAAQRSGSIPSFDAYSSSSSFSTSTAMYGQHPQQPNINGISSLNSSTSSSSGIPRTRSGFSDLHDTSQQSFTSYTRPSIDYPLLQYRAAPPPPISQASRPSPTPAAPLTRPPPVQPAPQRSNSSFNGLHQVSSYSSSRSQFPTDLNFNDNAVGLTGLKNLGNTCYMNSTIQCLSATIPFARYFKDRTYKHDVNTVNPLGTKGALADAVAELIRAIWAQQYTFLSPVTFRENICRVAPQFRGSDQHDAQEFLGFLLDGLHEDLNYVVKKPKPIEMTPDREHDLETLPQQIMSDREWEIYRMRNDSFVVQCFQGQFRNQLKCLTCGKTSTTYNTFMPLSIPIPSGRGITKATLEDCITAFVREEILDKDDAWFCPRCKTNRKASKRLSLSRLPPILVIHLKRFSFKGPFSDKIETQVQYPLSGLDLTNFLPPPLFDKRAPPLTSPPKGNVYDLFAVTNHYGNLSSGHYTAFVRSGRDWFNIGDSKCTQVDPRVVESAKSSYILYYAARS